MLKNLIEKVQTRKLSTGRFRKDFEGKDCKLVELSSKSPEIILEGYFFWPKKSDPSRLGGPFVDKNGDSWAYFKLSDERHGKWILHSQEEIHKINCQRAKYSKYSYPDEVLERLGMNQKYWERPYTFVNPSTKEETTTICSYSELSEEELEKITKEMTGIERVKSEIKIASIISQPGGGSPFLIPSIEKPYKFYIAGNDDASWTMCGNDDHDDDDSYYSLRSFSSNIISMLSYPSWYQIESLSCGWYFSN